MTKFKNYINELFTGKEEYIKEKIEKDCQPFLKE
jgi:hypothetical protein